MTFCVFCFFFSNKAESIVSVVVAATMTHRKVCHILQTAQIEGTREHHLLIPSCTLNFKMTPAFYSVSEGISFKFSKNSGNIRSPSLRLMTKNSVAATTSTETDLKLTFMLSKSRQDWANPHNLVKICLSGFPPSLKISIFNILIQCSIVKETVLNRKTHLQDQ